MSSFAFFKKILSASALLAALVAAPAPLAAGTLRVDPIRLEISNNRRTATVTVRNEEQVPVTIRAYPLRWTQVDGEDRYEDSSALIVSPPVFTIPAGGSQIVRVGLRNAAAANTAYRLMIEEVPQASPDGGIQVALRLNLPLFAMIGAGVDADLSWSARRGRDGNWTIEATNRGPGYVRVEPAAAAAATGIEAPEGTNFGTVLPRSTRRWTIGAAPKVTNQARFQSINQAADGAETQLATRRD